MDNVVLTDGAIARLVNGEHVESPTVQVVGIKNLKQNDGPDIYRLNLSDGKRNASNFMLSKVLSRDITGGGITSLTVIRLDKVKLTTVDGKLVTVILELTTVAKGSEIRKLLGQPVLIPTSSVPQASSSKHHDVQTIARFEGVPVSDINPFIAKSVPLRVRVAQKTEVRTWTNAKGTGRVFSMELLDETGSIRLSCFNNDVDKFYNSTKMGQVYVLKSFVVKPRNILYNNGEHGYELVASKDTSIVEYKDDSDIPMSKELSYKFVKINCIPYFELKSSIDVIGVCYKRGELQRIASHNNNGEQKKRDLWIVDTSMKGITLTIWGKCAEDFNDDTHPVIAVKSAKVSYFGGRSLTCSFLSTMKINPGLPEADALRQWFHRHGQFEDFPSLSLSRGVPLWKMLGQVDKFVANINSADTYFTAKVTVICIRKDNAVYKGCVESFCNKKLVQDPITNLLYCQKCNKEGEDFKWRLMLNVNLSDATGSIWASCFNETAELMLGHTAEHLGPLFGNGDTFGDIILQATFKSYIVKCRSRHEEFNGTPQLKNTVVEIMQINNGDNCRKLLQELKETMD